MSTIEDKKSKATVAAEPASADDTKQKYQVQATPRNPTAEITPKRSRV